MPCINYVIYNMKRMLKKSIPTQKNIQSFKEFQSLFASEIGVGEIPMNDDNIAARSKGVWSEIINEKKYDEKIHIYRINGENTKIK